jgi:mannosyltransferase
MLYGFHAPRAAPLDSPADARNQRRYRFSNVKLWRDDSNPARPWIIVMPHCKRHPTPAWVFNREYPVKVPIATDERLSYIAKITAYCFIALAIIRFWIMPLGSSFWCDESGTFWTIQGGPGAILTRYLEFPSTPPAYAIISWSAYTLGGAHEYAMRLPSVVAMALACLFLYRIMERLVDRESALPTVIAFVCLKPIIFAATDARPYAILLAIITGSTLALIKWMDSGLRRYAALYVVTAALIPYFHYLAMPVLGVQALYALARLREDSTVRVRELLIAGAAMGVLMLPVLPLLLEVSRQRHLHSFSSIPSMMDLAELLTPPVLMFSTMFGVLVGWIVFRKLRVVPAEIRNSSVCLLVALTLGPALFAFAVSLLSPTKIFVGRYMVGTLVGVAMMAGWAIGRIRPVGVRSVVISCTILSSIAAFGHAGRFWPPHKDENWREVLAAVRQAAGNSDIPVLIQSPFVESSNMNLDYNGKVPGWVLAPTLNYPTAGHVFAVAKSLETNLSYLEAKAFPAIEREGRFISVTGDPDFIQWLNGRFSGYSGHSLGRFHEVLAVMYERRADATRY